MTEIVLTDKITVEQIQVMGDDAMVVSAAMVSTLGNLDNGVDKEKQEGLINFLMKNRHGTPFEHSAMTIRVHAPIKVWREWHRHRIGWSYNEESGRYKQLDPVFWVPPRERLMIRPDGFKSSRPVFDRATDEEYAKTCLMLQTGYSAAYDAYEAMLRMRVDRGLARDVLGVGIFSSCYCTANPRSIMHFLELRTESTLAKRPSRPLYEIRIAAEQLEKLFAVQWPITYKAFCDNGRVAP